MATITPVSTAGGATAVLTYAAASGGGDSIAGTVGRSHVLHARNADSSSHDVILTGVGTACPFGLAAASHSLTTPVAAGTTAEIAVPGWCINPTTGAILVTYSAVTSVTVAATIS